MFVLPYDNGRILSKFSTTKNSLVITLGGLYDREFIWLYGNMIFMLIRSPFVTREAQRVFCEVGSLRTIVRMERIAGLPLRSKGGTTPMGNRLKRPRIALKLRTRRNDNLTLR